MAADPQGVPVNDEPQEKEGRGFPIALLLGIAAVTVLVGVVWLVSSQPSQVVAPAPLPFGETEKEYARRIRFTDIQMSRATNFLGHQVTIISGYVENMGNQTIREMSFALEFRDFSEQVVLREEVRFPGKMESPIEGGRRREFQFNFEKVPAPWNQQYPRFQIAGLNLEQ